MKDRARLELWEVKGEQDSYKVYVDGVYRGFMFKISDVRGWLAQLLDRDENAYICSAREDAERWLLLRCEFELWARTRSESLGMP